MAKKDSASEANFMTAKRGKNIPAKDGNYVFFIF